MKRVLIYITILLFGLSLRLSAQESVKDAPHVFALMPDDICPYLSMQQRLYIARYIHRGIIDTVPNILEGKSYATFYNESDNTLGIQVTKNLHWTITAGQDTVSIVESLCAPRCAHTVFTYRLNDWRLLSVKREAVELETAEEMIEY